MTKRKVPIPLLAIIGAVHVVAVAITWRDIARRPSDRVRGPKWFWCLATGLNTGAATLAYVAVRRVRDGIGSSRVAKLVPAINEEARSGPREIR